MNAVQGLIAELTEESLELDDFVTGLDPAEWSTVTTPEGWTVGHQIGHLAWTDEMSLQAIEAPDRFVAFFAAMTPQEADAKVDVVAAEWAALPTDTLLARWRRGRRELAEALAAVPEGVKIVWAGPPMSAVSMATARLMETWAHSLDVHDAFGVDKPRTDRVRHVCHIGVRTRTYVHVNRGEPVPATEVRVELTSPSGQQWVWGPSDAPERVTGPAWDFALLATRRRHRDDVAVVAHGAGADRWLDIAQTFAGQPGNDPVRWSERR